ncbi:hypothetical protein KI387_003168, partial [Taxus chinensis]
TPTKIHSNRGQLGPDHHRLNEPSMVTENQNRCRLAKLTLVRGDRRWSLSEVDTNVQDVQIEPPVPQTPMRRSQRV